MEEHLKVKDLSVEIDGKEIVREISFEINKGDKVALMGPNGSGKSTICKVIMGDKSYKVKNGEIIINGENITKEGPDIRAKKGLFMVFQEPEGIEGLNALRLMRSSYSKMFGNVNDFTKEINELTKKINIDSSLLTKDINLNESGGEKKKLEILQMLLLKPKFALIDEFDSGLDVDSVKLISDLINKSEFGALIITHNPNVFNYLKIDKVLVLEAGKIKLSGGKEILDRISKEGYSSI